MSGSNLSVKITADISEVQTKFAILQAQTSAMGSEMRKLASSSSIMIDPVAHTRLQQIAGDYAAGKIQLAAMRGELGAATGGILGMSAAAEGGHGSISSLTREARALFDELSSGRTRQTPGTIAILLQRSLGLGPAMLGAVAGVGALAGGLAYLAIQANKAGNEINQIDISSTFAGNMDITRTVIDRYITELSKAGNVSSSEARKIVASFAEIPGMTSAALGTLSATMSQFAQETHQSADKAAEDWAKLFAGNVSAGEFAKKLEGITQLSQGQLDQARSADQSGDAAAVMTEKLRLLDQVVSAGAPGLKTYATNAADLATALAAGESGTDQMELQTTLAAANTAVIDKDTEARRRNLAVQAQTAATPQQTLQAGIKVADQENPVAKQIDEDNAKIQVMETALAAATDPTQVRLLTAALAETGQKLQDLQSGPVLERMRTQIQEVAATWDGSQTGMLAKQISIAQAELANVTQGSRQELEVKGEVSRLEVEMRRAASQQVIEGARDQVAQIGAAEQGGAIERLVRQQAVWADLIAGEKVVGQARVEAQRALDQTTSELSRTAAAQFLSVEREKADSAIRIARMQVEAQKGVVDLSAAQTQAEAANRLQILKNATNQEYSLDQQQLQDQLAGLKDGTLEYQKVFDQITELKAKEVLDLEALDKQYAEAQKRIAKEQVSAWAGAVKEIEGAEGTFISDILTKRKSLSQSLLAIGSQMVQSEITNDIRAETTKLLLYKETDVAKKALDQGGFLFHYFTSQKDVLTDKAAEQAKTSAAISGAAARKAADASAAAATQSQAAILGPQAVMADAAKAYAGVFAGVSQLPYGYLIAPELAAAAFAEVAAYAPLAGLAIGTNYVPQTGLYQLHEGESVTPKEYNPAAGGDEGGGGHTEVHNYGATHISAVDTRGFAALVSQPGNRRALAQSARRYINRGGR